MNLCHSCNCIDSCWEGEGGVTGWQTGAGMKLRKYSETSSLQQVSFTWLHNGWTPQGNGSNNCTGNYSIKRSNHPPTPPPPLAFSLSLFFSLYCRGWGRLQGCWVREQSGLGVPWPGHLARCATTWLGDGGWGWRETVKTHCLLVSV